MKLDPKGGGAKSTRSWEMKTVAREADGSSTERPFPELPAQMLIAIDGWAQTGKNSAGEIVAEQLGAVLVDSGRFYRAVAKACLGDNVNISNPATVEGWCRGVALDVRLARDGCRVEEAHVAVNGSWFGKEEL